VTTYENAIEHQGGSSTEIVWKREKSTDSETGVILVSLARPPISPPLRIKEEKELPKTTWSPSTELFPSSKFYRSPGRFVTSGMVLAWGLNTQNTHAPSTINAPPMRAGGSKESN